MKVISTIFAVLLLLLGGGCTVAFLVLGIPLGWREMLPWWLFLGLLPLVAGVLILRAQRLGRTGPADASKQDEPREPPEPGDGR